MVHQVLQGKEAGNIGLGFLNCAVQFFQFQSWVRLPLADFYLVRKQKIVVDDLFTMSKTANYWYKGGYNPAAVAATVVGALLAMAPVLLGGMVWGMTGASQYSWFIGCGVAFGLYYVLATRGPWRMSALQVEPA